MDLTSENIMNANNLTQDVLVTQSDMMDLSNRNKTSVMLTNNDQ